MWITFLSALNKVVIPESRYRESSTLVVAVYKKTVIPGGWCRESVVAVIASKREAIYVVLVSSKDCPVAMLLAMTKHIGRV